MATYNEIFGAAERLPAEERVRLVQALWDTVTPEDWPPPGDAWADEAQRRSREYDSGEATALPWQEVRARARREAGLDG